MTTAYTSLLGLALPVTGELSGTWGTVVNDSITSLLDTSVAGTTNVSTDTDVTLTTTTGAANTARQAILLFSGARTALRTVTAPAQSKIYTVINATTGGFSVKLVGSGPTTGLTIPNGASAVVAWNGSDFVEVGAGSIGNLVVNGTLTVTGATTLQSTLAVTGNITNTAGTANGVAYLNGSKVVTSGSALTFDGTNLGVGGTATALGTYRGAEFAGTTATTGGFLRMRSSDSSINSLDFTDSNGRAIFTTTNHPVRFGVNDTEQMRLTSTGLGIGTSSPSQKLDVNGDAGITASESYLYFYSNYSVGNNSRVRMRAVGAGGGSGYGGDFRLSTRASNNSWNTDALVVDSSANVGIGTSSPSEKLHVNSGTGNVPALFESTDPIAVVQFKDNNSTLFNAVGVQTNSLIFYSGDNINMRLDSSGNLGLGVTPSAWNTLTVQQVKNAHVGGYVNNGYFGTNCFYDGTWKYIATGSASRLELTGGQHQFFTAPSGTAGNSITFTQAMTLDASGQLVIGGTSAVTGAGLTVGSSNGSRNLISIPANSGGFTAFPNGGTIVASGYGVTYFNFQSGGLLFGDSTSGTERARIDSSGNLLVGLTTAAAGSASTVYKNQDSTWTWRVESGATSLPNGILVKYSGTSPNNTGSQFIYCQDSGDAERMSVRSNGGIANYSGNNVNLSDRREKTNFAPAGSYLDKICAIPVQTFNYIDQNLEEDGGLTLGVVAQDVQAVAPELVMESNWGSKEDPKMRLSIYQTDLQYALMKCIQEQQAIIQSLKARLDAANL